jgi:hypothetical protein
MPNSGAKRLTNLLPDSSTVILNNNNTADNFFKKRFVTYLQTLLKYYKKVK